MTCRQHLSSCMGAFHGRECTFSALPPTPTKVPFLAKRFWDGESETERRENGEPRTSNLASRRQSESSIRPGTFTNLAMHLSRSVFVLKERCQGCRLIETRLANDVDTVSASATVIVELCNALNKDYLDLLMGSAWLLQSQAGEVKTRFCRGRTGAFQQVQRLTIKQLYSVIMRVTRCFRFQLSRFPSIDNDMYAC